MTYSPPRIGGEAAHQENIAKPPLKAQTGWSVQNDHPVRAFLMFLMARPPLLSQEGNTLSKHYTIPLTEAATYCSRTAPIYNERHNPWSWRSFSCLRK